TEECYAGFMSSLRTACCEIFTPCCVLGKIKRPEVPDNCIKRIFFNGTYENDVFKNVLGFIFGVLVTIILYLIMVFQIKFTPLTSSLVCTFLGAVLTLGLAFTSQTRLMVLLMIPQFFTRLKFMNPCSGIHKQARIMCFMLLENRGLRDSDTEAYCFSVQCEVRLSQKYCQALIRKFHHKIYIYKTIGKMEMEDKLEGFHLQNHYKDFILKYYDEMNRNGNGKRKILKNKCDSSGVSVTIGSLPGQIGTAQCHNPVRVGLSLDYAQAKIKAYL
ncbi:Hypothetical predicted protein, partial [Mytilus galloprovincialis]